MTEIHQKLIDVEPPPPPPIPLSMHELIRELSDLIDATSAENISFNYEDVVKQRRHAQGVLNKYAY